MAKAIFKPCTQFKGTTGGLFLSSSWYLSSVCSWKMAAPDALWTEGEYVSLWNQVVFSQRDVLRTAAGTAAGSYTRLQSGCHAERHRWQSRASHGSSVWVQAGIGEPEGMWHLVCSHMCSETGMVSFVCFCSKGKERVLPLQWCGDVTEKLGYKTYSIKNYQFQFISEFLIYLYTLPVHKKLCTVIYLLDRLLLWLRSTFAVAFFRQPYAMLQHLFPSRVAFIFGQDFVLMTGESNRSFSLFQHAPITFNGVVTKLADQLWFCCHHLW